MNAEMQPSNSPKESTKISKREMLEEAFVKLQRMAEILREMGFRIIDSSISPQSLSDPTAEAGFPIVRDGLDGIRVSYSRHDGLKIWFTNEFEGRDNPRRLEVIDRLGRENLL